MTSNAAFSALAEHSPDRRAHAARVVFGGAFNAEFVAQTGFVQYRNGKVPRYRRLDVEVDLQAPQVVIRGELAVFDLFVSSWAFGRKSAAVERTLGADEEQQVQRMAEAAANASPEELPVVPVTGAVGGRALRVVVGVLLGALALLAVLALVVLDG